MDESLRGRHPLTMFSTAPVLGRSWFHLYEQYSLIGQFLVGYLVTMLSKFDLHRPPFLAVLDYNLCVICPVWTRFIVLGIQWGFLRVMGGVGH